MFVVIPNLNGEDWLKECLESIDAQTLRKITVVVVDNASTDSSKEIFDKFNNHEMVWLQQDKNHGFAGGVNIGIRYAIEKDAKYIALFNNDATMDKGWVNSQKRFLDENGDVGIVTGKLIKNTKPEKYDSVGDQYSCWGGPFPEGRDQIVSDKYNDSRRVLAASGGASVYRVVMLNEIGLFDEDFFAYYEDVDISLRANLAGWKVMYNPAAVAHHEQGGTSVKMPGFGTYQHFKNLPMIVVKDLPFSSFIRVFPRFILAYTMSFISHTLRGKFWPAFKGVLMALVYTPKKVWQRWRIQSKRKISPYEMWDLFYKGPPPNSNFERMLNKIKSTLLFWRRND